MRSTEQPAVMDKSDDKEEDDDDEANGDEGAKMNVKQHEIITKQTDAHARNK